MTIKMLERYHEWRISSRTRTWDFRSHSRKNGYMYNIFNYDNTRILLSHIEDTDDISVVGYLCNPYQKDILTQKSVDVVVIKNNKERKKVWNAVREFYRNSPYRRYAHVSFCE